MLCGSVSVFWLGHNIFFSSSNLAADFTANALFLQGFGIGTNLNGPSWSISTEFAAYLLFPLFIALTFHRLVFVVGIWVESPFKPEQKPEQHEETEGNGGSDCLARYGAS